jgi:hypothetical protein
MEALLRKLEYRMYSLSCGVDVALVYTEEELKDSMESFRLG